jgi:Na+/H+ antiporter NhaC
MVPISSWVAPITAYLQQAGININSSAPLHAEPFTVYLHTIPFMIYSLLTIITILVIIFWGISYGPMRHYEKMATPTNILHEKIEIQGEISDLFIPLITLLCTIIIGILYMGNWYGFGGTNTILNAFRSNTQIFLILCIASLMTFATACARALFKGQITINAIPQFLYAGTGLMRNSLTMLFLISILSGLLRTDLQTGQYLASIVTGTVSVTLLPCIIFLISICISIATGTSWGTFGLMLPITIPMLITIFNLKQGITAHDVPLLYPILGAIFSGALCGDHISPFSETTVMAAVCTQSIPMEHVKTQLFYALPPIIGCAIFYITSGLLYTHTPYIRFFIPWIMSIVTCLIALFSLNRINNK